MGGQNPVLGGQRNEFLKGPVCDNYPSCMCARITHHSLDHPAGINDLLGYWVLVVFRRKLRAFSQCIFEGDIEVIRDHLGQLVRLSVRQIPHPGDIPHHHLGSKGSKGDNIGYTISSIFFADIFNDFTTATHTKIDIKVRGGYPLRVQKSLKKQTKAERINIGNAQNISNQTAGTRSSAGPHWNPLLPCPLHEVGNDQEVVIKSGFPNYPELIIQAYTQFSDQRLFIRTVFRILIIHFISFFKPLNAENFEILHIILHFCGYLGRKGKNRIIIFPKRKFHITHFRHREGVGNRFRNLPKQDLHFLPRF